LIGFTKDDSNEDSEDNDGGDSTNDEISDFSFKELVLLCHKLTKIIDNIELKNNKLKNKNLKTCLKNDKMENENVKKVEILDCGKCLKFEIDFVHFNENFQKCENEIVSLKKKLKLSSFKKLMFYKRS